MQYFYWFYFSLFCLSALHYLDMHMYCYACVSVCSSCVASIASLLLSSSCLSALFYLFRVAVRLAELWRKIRFWDMPTIKHTNKSWQTCSNCDSPLQAQPLCPCHLPLAPWPPWPPWDRLSYSAAFSLALALAKAGGKPFVYFIIVGYLAAACSCSSFCIWSVAKTLKTKFI